MLRKPEREGVWMRQMSGLHIFRDNPKANTSDTKQDGYVG